MKTITFGNCQAAALTRIFSHIFGDGSAKFIELQLGKIPKQDDESKIDYLKNDFKQRKISTELEQNDLIIVQEFPMYQKLFDDDLIPKDTKIIVIPKITYTGFHPDLVHVSTNQNNTLESPTGRAHSSLAFYGWLNDLCIDDTLELFNKNVFTQLGYFDYTETSKKLLITENTNCSLSLGSLIERWSGQGQWMYSVNHPKLFVMIDIAHAILECVGIKDNKILDTSDAIEDRLANLVYWSVYPEIGEKLGIESNYNFKFKGEEFDLEDFLEESFEIYSYYEKNDLRCGRILTKPYEYLKLVLNRNKKTGLPLNNKSIVHSDQLHLQNTNNPYKDLPDYQFWRRAIENIPMEDINPVVSSGFTLSKKDKVATSGSCFAQHISRTLKQHGFNYYITEKGERLTNEEILKCNYGVFSARYGNIYTTRQLLQLYDRAYGTFIPEESYWERNDGRYVDPFRPQIEPEGFPSTEILESSRTEHFRLVREMFENLDVFVFTFGLTEAWRNQRDGAVYPLAPGVVAGVMDPVVHEFVNFNLSDVVTDMQLFVNRLFEVNPQARLILTVSPVPLIATYEDRHVLVSNTYSKSVLRVAVEEICSSNTNCEYFPSYEIITGNYSRSKYYEEDLRTIKTEGVEHVMRLFMKHYATKSMANTLEEDLTKENRILSEVVCDEEAIDV